MDFQKNIIDKYLKAQKHFEKGNYFRAKWLFEMITMDFSISNSDRMRDINLHNYCEEYIQKIDEITVNYKFKLFYEPEFFIIFAILIIIITIVYLIIHYAI